MKNKVFLTVITVLLVLVLAAQGFLFVKVYKMDAALLDLQPKEEEKEIVQVDTSVVQIDTPYCILKYPSEWIDQIAIDTVKLENGVDTVVFSGLINGKKAELLTVYFGVEGDDIYIGDLDYAGKKIRVGLQMAFIDETEWTAEEYQTLCDMQKIKDQVQKSIFES